VITKVTGESAVSIFRVEEEVDATDSCAALVITYVNT
jgi:hypothetical protein